MASRGLSLLVWVFFIHLAGIYLYARGFLLNRLSLSDITTCPDGQCILKPTHRRAVVLVIDALRFDFLSPTPPEPPSPYHHNVLSLPQELTASRPTNSFLFEMYSDPPTTTLQRLKGITTGSLPTFIDMGSNFGGSSITEDSFIGQLKLAGKKIAFMGDDTWTTVFPDTFEQNMTFPYDSFNVEDLHTVDEGVIEHLFPLLEDKRASWDLLIGHFLGVDHVGHRVGPGHPTMKTKLAQMDDVLRQVVDKLDDDTLLILMGDHGMDRKGDHGGDGEHETSAALWVYSKGPQLLHPKASIPSFLLATRLFPSATAEHRHIQQIDLAPTLSLMLGLPIPFNNLGTVVPELFWHDKAGNDYTRALSLNAQQIKRYLDTYRASPSGAELDKGWSELDRMWRTVKFDAVHDDVEMQWLAMTMFTRNVLAVCRMLWAQFNVSLMGLGLVLLVTGVVATTLLYLKVGRLEDRWESWLAGVQRWYLSSTLSGGLLGFVAWVTISRYVKGLGLVEALLFSAAFTSSAVVIFTSLPPISISNLSLKTFSAVPLPLILHAVTFASNSFTVWEDRVLNYLLISSVVPNILVGLTAPTTRMRLRILGFSGLFALCVRLMAVSTVCREEQQPFCHVTFFASSSLPSPPLAVLVLAVPVSLALPLAMKRFLRISKSDRGTAALVLPWLLPTAFLLGSAFWIIEHLDSSEQFGAEWAGTLRTARTLCARIGMGSVLFLGYALWWLVPLCLEIKTEAKPGVTAQGNPKREVTVLGFANAFGAPYLIFWSLFLGLLFPATQLTGQVVLALAAVAVLAHLEVVDSVRDVRGLDAVFASGNPSALLQADNLSAPPPLPLRFAEITPLALLAVHAFFTTGHQAAIPSIQWKTAFVLTRTLTYPFSPLLVALNTFGPHFLIALATPLLALWNVAPLPQPAADVKVRGDAVRAGLGMMLYHAVLLLSSAVCSAWLRRHLMVWKIFAPRFMLAAITVVVVDLAVLFGVGVGAGRVTMRVSRLFSAMNPDKKTS